MHSFHGESVNIHFNGDYSGDVVINNKKDGDEYKEITVDIKDIFDFVAGYIRSEKISKLEEMESKDILLG
jgi:hypothetical protein